MAITFHLWHLAFVIVLSLLTYGVYTTTGEITGNRTSPAIQDGVVCFMLVAAICFGYLIGKFSAF